MLLGLLMAAGTPASTGCFNGGAFVGAQAGFTHVMLKRLAKDKAVTPDEANKAYDALVAILQGTANYKVYDKGTPAEKKLYDDATAGLKDTTLTVKLDKSGVDYTTGDGKKAIAQAVADYALDPANTDTDKAKSATIYILVDNKATVLAADGKDLVTQDPIAKLADAKKATTAKWVAADAETKYTSNNGFAGLHAGYLGRVNDKFLVGGLVEGNWVFGQDMKVNDKEEKDTKARFNVGAYLRAMFNLTEKFMAGADLGFSGQEIRQLKTGQTKDKESKWFWNPAARLVLGVALTDNILATAHFGGVFPMIKQDSLRDSAVKAKYSNFHGGVGISYVFGG